MNILMLDNFDSFTYNLVHYLEAQPIVNVTVKRNNELDLKEVEAFDKIVLSPGPGLPREADVMLELIKQYASKKPILGICLGHQAIAEAFGGMLYNLDTVYHGVSSNMEIKEPHYVFNGLPVTLKVGRYHSWAVEKPLPNPLSCLATDEQGVIMALRHKEFDVVGLQFHPESVLTPLGKQIIHNWVKY